MILKLTCGTDFAALKYKIYFIYLGDGGDRSASIHSLYYNNFHNSISMQSISVYDRLVLIYIYIFIYMYVSICDTKSNHNLQSYNNNNPVIFIF